MNAGVERIGAAADTQKARRLFERLGAETRDVQQVLARPEGAVGISVLDDVAGQLPPKPRDIGKQLPAGRVDLNPHRIDTTDYDVVEALLEQRLVYVVLVLADSDGLGIDLHQLR